MKNSYHVNVKRPAHELLSRFDLIIDLELFGLLFSNFMDAISHIAGYVSEIAKLLANHESREFKEISDRYQAKVPPPLSSQFEVKLTREEAIEKFKVRQQMEAIPMFPSGK